MIRKLFMESHLTFSRWNIAFYIPDKIPKHPGTCMVPRGVLCEIPFILDLKKRQSRHHDQCEILNTRMIF